MSGAEHTNSYMKLQNDSDRKCTGSVYKNRKGEFYGTGL